MIDMTPISNTIVMSIPAIVDLLKNEPDGVYRIFLNNGKMYQGIKSNGEVTTAVNSSGGVFRRAFARSTKSTITYIEPEWVEVYRLEDINIFLLIAQVKGWL